MVVVRSVVSKQEDFILQGDFDVQVDFQLDENFHNHYDANAKLILEDRNGYGLEISLRRGIYLSKEVFPGGSGIHRNWTGTRDLSGKLRIVRVGNQVITYYWANGWREHARWQPQVVTGDLKIAIDAWNWPPYFSAFSVRYDNLIAYNDNVDILCSP